ncbi:unnamed protein product [Pylaiella littoralis]
METGSSPPPPFIGDRTSPLVMTSPGASGSTSAGGVHVKDEEMFSLSSPPPGGIIVGETVLLATPEKEDKDAKPLYLAQHASTPTIVRRDRDNPPNYGDHHVGQLRQEVIRRAKMDRVRSRHEGKGTTIRIVKGGGIEGLFTKQSTAKKDLIVEALVPRDKYVETT